MFRTFLPLAQVGAFVFTALLAVSPAAAQPSSLGHTAAPGYRPASYPDVSLLRVYPGDKGFHSTMQIEQYYQTAARLAPLATAARVTPPRYSVRSQTPVPLNVIVSISEPAEKPTLVNVRGPDGKVRSFAMAGGQDTIQPRTIVMRPGDSLTIRFSRREPSCRKRSETARLSGRTRGLPARTPAATPAKSTPSSRKMRAFGSPCGRRLP